MTPHVIDASAFLTIMRDEIGATLASARIPEAFMSTVNASEAFMRGVEKGIPLDLMLEFLAAQEVRMVPFDGELSVSAALLRPSTKRAGLSFADRACIATAIRLKATVVTADRAWADLDLPCPVELIR
ncbi:MAG: type II toxin-antitoxin system VapC family toxin [Mesorhizobium sp.]